MREYGIIPISAIAFVWDLTYRAWWCGTSLIRIIHKVLFETHKQRLEKQRIEKQEQEDQEKLSKEMWDAFKVKL